MLANELIAGLSDSPITAAIGCAAIGPTIAWTIGMVNWMIMGEIDGMSGFAAIVLGFGLCFVAINPPEPMYAMFAFCGIVGMMIVFPIARRQLVRRAMIQIDIEQIERAYALLAKRPDNEVTRFKLAEAVYARGMVGQAIEIADSAIDGMPLDMFSSEFKTVQKWKKQARDPNLFRPIPCLDCNFYNKPSDVYCQKCGSEYLAKYARGRWLGATLTRKLIASWIIAMVALVGLPVFLAFDQLPAAIKVTGVMLQVALVGFLVWRSFLKKEDAIL